MFRLQLCYVNGYGRARSQCPGSARSYVLVRRSRSRAVRPAETGNPSNARETGLRDRRNTRRTPPVGGTRVRMTREAKRSRRKIVPVFESVGSDGDHRQTYRNHRRRNAARLQTSSTRTRYTICTFVAWSCRPVDGDTPVRGFDGRRGAPYNK